jgi:hypothetical protein
MTFLRFVLDLHHLNLVRQFSPFPVLLFLASSANIG